MIKHIVMFKLHDDDNQKDLNIKLLKDKLEKLKIKIPEIRFLETGINISTSPSAFDLVLTTRFDNEKDLESYRNHPGHQAVVKFLNEVKDEIVVVDYIEP